MVTGVDNGNVDGFEINLRSALVGVAQSMTNDTDWQFVLTGDGGPGVASPVHAEVLRDVRFGGNSLQQLVYTVLDVAILVALRAVGGVDDG